MLNKEEAEKILMDDGKINPGPWVEHSIKVGIAMQRLAEKLNLDAEKAYVIGVLHDIGRIKKGIGLRHIIDGHNYMLELGYPEIARRCLTHTFFIKDVHSSCCLWDISSEEEKIMQDYLNQCEYDVYDKLVQIGDCLADADGFKLIEQRLLDVHIRKGVNEYTIPTWKAIFKLQDEIEELLNESIYGVFPEIKDRIGISRIREYMTF